MKRKKRPVRKLERKVETRVLPPVDLQCIFFGGKVKPEDNWMCPTPGKFREYSLVFCDLHYLAMCMDPQDWTDEMMGYTYGSEEPQQTA